MSEIESQTEEKIFNSAREIFIAKGLDGARMKDIAAHAGINKALLHYYFRTKEQLFNTVFENIAGELFQRFTPVVDPSLSIEEKIRFFFREHINYLQNNPRLPVFILYEIYRNPERFKRLVSNIDIGKFYNLLYDQHKEELNRFGVTKESLPQLMISIAALSIFPFAARGVIEVLFENLGLDFKRFIEERKSFVADFVLNALKNNRV